MEWYKTRQHAWYKTVRIVDGINNKGCLYSQSVSAYCDLYRAIYTYSELNFKAHVLHTTSNKR